jgi:hypothetical protein
MLLYLAVSPVQSWVLLYCLSHSSIHPDGSNRCAGAVTVMEIKEVLSAKNSFKCGSKVDMSWNRQGVKS